MATHYCQFCGQRITGRGRKLHHKQWSPGVFLRVCTDCYQHKPRCRICDLPMAGESISGACPTCSQSLCLACGKQVKGKYYEFDGIGPYCEECCRLRSACDVCSAPLTDEYWRLSDGRNACAYCRATAIFAPVDAISLYEEMKALVAASWGLALNVPTGLALVDRNQLGEIIQQQQSMERNNGADVQALDANRTLGIYARRGMRRGIYVQTGLPRMLFLQVAAHEFAHAWQGENCPVLRTGMVHEGFAEWLAYRVLGYYGYQRGQERMCARTDIYGQGLRWALELETRSGLNGLLEACRRPA